MVYRNNQYKKTKISHKPINKRLFVALFLTIIAVLAIGFGAWYHHHTKSTHNQPAPTSSSTPSDTSNTSKINYNPPTAQDQQANQQHKDEIVQQQQQQSQSSQTPTGTTSSATPTIMRAEVYAGNVEVSSYVPNIVENGGTCTLTATLGSATVTKTVTAVANAQDTNCPLFQVPVSQFSPKGTWTVSVHYSSSHYSGTSATKTISVQ